MHSQKISAGLILTNGRLILGCIPYGRKDLLDIPKGLIENNETPEEAVIREVKEETGLDIYKQQINQIGKYLQYKGKYLIVFLLQTDKLPEIKTMYCNSTFLDKRTNKLVQEHVGFKYLPIEEIPISFYKSLVPILMEVCSGVEKKEMQRKKIKEENKQDKDKEKEIENEDDKEIDQLLKNLKKQNEEKKI